MAQRHLFEIKLKTRELRSPRRSSRATGVRGYLDYLITLEYALAPGPFRANFDLIIPCQGWDLNPQVSPVRLLFTKPLCYQALVSRQGANNHLPDCHLSSTTRKNAKVQKLATPCLETRQEQVSAKNHSDMR